METHQYTVVIEPDEDAYHAFAPSLPGCHTFGATVDEARVNISEAIGLHVEAMLEDGEAIPVEHEPPFISSYGCWCWGTTRWRASRRWPEVWRHSYPVRLRDSLIDLLVGSGGLQQDRFFSFQLDEGEHKSQVVACTACP